MLDGAMRGTIAIEQSTKAALIGDSSSTIVLLKQGAIRMGTNSLIAAV
jgi:hypothetical protein